MTPIIWILFGLIEFSRCASIAENAKLVGYIGYFTKPVNELNGANYNVFSVPIVFYPILQKPSNSHYLPRDREAIEAGDQNTSGTDSGTDVTETMDLSTVTPSPFLDDIPPINLLPLDNSPSSALLKPSPPLLVPTNTGVPPTIPLPPGSYGYGYSNSNQNVDSITFTTSHPPVLYPLNTPSQLYQFRPSPLQTNHFNHFRPSHFGFGLPEGNTNFITGKSRLDNFPYTIL